MSRYIVPQNKIPMTVHTSTDYPKINELPPPPKPKNSTFLVTCNTNFKPTTNSESRAAAAELKHAAENVFGSVKNIAPLVKFLDGKQWSDETIDNVDVLIGVELGTGKRGGRIHAHIKVEIDHYSKIHLNPPMIKEHMNLHMHEYGVRYVNISVRNNSVFNIENYIRK